jgi:hypothetical protein
MVFFVILLEEHTLLALFESCERSDWKLSPLGEASWLELLNMPFTEPVEVNSIYNDLWLR